MGRWQGHSWCQKTQEEEQVWSEMSSVLDLESWGAFGGTSRYLELRET